MKDPELPIRLLWISPGMPIWFRAGGIPAIPHAGIVVGKPFYRHMKTCPYWAVRLGSLDARYQLAHGGARTAFYAVADAISYRYPEPKKAKPKRRR